jgi:hypothetical protein
MAAAPCGPPPGDDGGVYAHLVSMQLLDRPANEYAARLIADGYDTAAAVDAMSLEELSQKGVKEGHIKAIERHRSKATGAAAPAAIPEHETPLGRSLTRQPWEELLTTPGPKRLDALQQLCEQWYPKRWVLGRELGSGSAGVVVSASDSHVGQVAIKWSTGHREKREHVGREAVLLQRTSNHANVVQRHDHRIFEDSIVGIVM